MPSPFPGMDPYIESAEIWPDFHGPLLAAIRADLNANLPKGFAASTELYVWPQEADQPENSFVAEPDVYVYKEPKRIRSGPGPRTIPAPATIVLPRLRPRKHRYLKIIDSRTKRVVTAVEVLSPTNKKPGEHRSHYLDKRSEYLASKISFVELDLLRGGRRPPLGKHHPEISDFYTMVCRSWEFPSAGFWTFGIRDPLPDIPVPVKRGLGDTPLHLRWCVERAYDEGRYDETLPYDEPLKPRPRDDDRDWIRELLAARHGSRG